MTNQIFLPWREVISLNGISIVTLGQFCPACLADNAACKQAPYFRLTWESAEVMVRVKKLLCPKVFWRVR